MATEDGILFQPVVFLIDGNSHLIRIVTLAIRTPVVNYLQGIRFSLIVTII